MAFQLSEKVMLIGCQEYAIWHRWNIFCVAPVKETSLADGNLSYLLRLVLPSMWKSWFWLSQGCDFYTNENDHSTQSRNFADNKLVK